LQPRTKADIIRATITVQRFVRGWLGRIKLRDLRIKKQYLDGNKQWEYAGRFFWVKKLIANGHTGSKFFQVTQKAFREKAAKQKLNFREQMEMITGTNVSHNARFLKSPGPSQSYINKSDQKEFSILSGIKQKMKFTKETAETRRGGR
jgi:hypothetical protein